MHFDGTEKYVATDDLKVAVNAAAKLRRPLLVKGEPGTGKTVLAQEIAKAGVGKDDTVLLYCQSGRRSGIALDTLKGLGFSKAQNVGGIEVARKTLAKK